MQLKGNQNGFTLIEILVVIAIMGTLAAVILPSFFRFFGHGEEEANQAELTKVQAAMEALLAKNGLNLIDARLTPGTNDFSALPTAGGSALPEPLYPGFLRFGNADNPTKCLYTWNIFGKLKQSCP